jgi:hypothetical protein
LSGADQGDWLAGIILTSVSWYPTSGKLYLGGFFGRFGVYELYTDETSPKSTSFLDAGEAENVTFALKHTGVGYRHVIDVNATPGYAAIASNDTEDRTVCLGTCAQTPPSVPVLLTPTNASNVSTRFPTFTWQASTDANFDPITYEWNLTHPAGCAAVPAVNTSSTSYTSLTRLCVDQNYTWTVRACDAFNCSAWATSWRFRIPSVVGVAFTTAVIDFGTLNPSLPTLNVTNDTLDNSPPPLRYNNTGNVDISTQVQASTPLWGSAALNTAFWTAGDENGTLANLTSGYRALATNVTTGQLRELEIGIWVPQGESGGAKQGVLTVLGASIE